MNIKYFTLQPSLSDAFRNWRWNFLPNGNTSEAWSDLPAGSRTNVGHPHSIHCSRAQRAVAPEQFPFHIQKHRARTKQLPTTYRWLSLATYALIPMGPRSHD